jgi:putative restriction endonuclease
MTSADEWLAKLARLKVDRARGDPAPHKPLLLLVVLDLAEQEQLPDNGELPLTPELAFRFCSFWGVVAHRRAQRPDVRYPFHHLQSDGLWQAFAAGRTPSPDRRMTRCVVLPADLVALMRDPAWREQARRILIARYFQPEERTALYAAVGLPVPSEEEIEQDARSGESEAARTRGRELRFRVNVVAAYKYTCALTGYRLTTIAGSSIVDAAHIHQFAKSRNNDPCNGLALCKNAHWLFDNGLWTLTDAYTVLVAEGEFAEDSPDQKALSAYQGQRIRLPGNPVLWPSPVYLAWHREHKFQGS